jgi:4-hydroxy-tetrahydrodipicolinate reductase
MCRVSGSVIGVWCHVIRVCVAGISGWVGQSLAPAITGAADLSLTGAVSRSKAGQHVEGSEVVIRATAAEALDDGADVFVDYTAPDVVKTNVLAAIARGVHVVIGTSGLDDGNYQEIERAALERGVGVLAAGNFAISAVLLQHFAVLAARYMPSWEIIDYAGAGKVDAPSGTTRELAHRLAGLEQLPLDKTQGSRESRGMNLNGTQIHSLRLPGYMIGAEVIFGREDERLSLRYDGGAGAQPYVGGTLLAIRRVGSFTGLRRGLGELLTF